MRSEPTLAITVVIGTKNEEVNLPDCLASLTALDQVIVVDSNSTDRTKEIAVLHGAEYVVFEYDGGWPKKRNWALQNLPNFVFWAIHRPGCAPD